MCSLSIDGYVFSRRASGWRCGSNVVFLSLLALLTHLLMNQLYRSIGIYSLSDELQS